MTFRDGLANVTDDHLDIEMTRRTPRAFETLAFFKLLVHTALDFLHDDEPLFAFDLDRKSRHTMGLQRRVALFDGRLDILWMMGPGSDHDDVFESAGDKEFTMT